MWNIEREEGEVNYKGKTQITKRKRGKQSNSREGHGNKNKDKLKYTRAKER